MLLHLSEANFIWLLALFPIILFLFNLFKYFAKLHFIFYALQSAIPDQIEVAIKNFWIQIKPLLYLFTKHKYTKNLWVMWRECCTTLQRPLPNFLTRENHAPIIGVWVGFPLWSSNGGRLGNSQNINLLKVLLSLIDECEATCNIFLYLVWFQVNSWLTWLESVSSEDEDEEDAWFRQYSFQEYPDIIEQHSFFY